MTQAKTIDISRALAIQGWMEPQELVWLAQQASTHKCIVEIGSHLGRSTRSLLDHTEGIVYAFDDWRGPRDVYMEKAERDSLWAKFSVNIKDRRESCHVCIGEFDASYQLNKELHPDMVFVDGSHEYEDVKRDIEFWKPRLIPGGLLCGHDANWGSVMQAVKETLGKVEVAEGTMIWYRIV